MNCPRCKKKLVMCSSGYKLYSCPTHSFMDYDEIKAMREAIKAKRRKAK
jgi:hypothetical protein